MLYSNPKPVVKWVGGKSQLLDEISKKYPLELGKSINKYAEPFVGGGAVLFDVLGKYNFNEVYISDINAELINMYQMIRDNIDGLIELLEKYEREFRLLDNEKRKDFYYNRRDNFNKLIISGKSTNSIESAALFIFLNHTCFNGLYRVNKKGLFNVPMGAYKNPTICDEKNLRSVSEKLKNIIIICADYKESLSFIDENTFAYFDPPYRPLTETANFTAYSENSFNDKAQEELAEFIKTLSNRGSYVIASNSDPKNVNPNDDFFEKIYANLTVDRVYANRMVNCNATARGKVTELLICSY